MNNWDQLADDAVIQKTIESLAKRNVTAEIVANGAEALEKIKATIPKGVSVMNGSSTTLEQIGYTEYLKSGNHGWNDLHQAVNAENDQAKRAILRKQSVLSDYYLGSVHAVSETGEMIIASNSGSQLPHIVYTSPNLLFIVSTKKIVATVADGIKRIEEHVLPLEDERMKKAYGVGSAISKLLIFRQENPMMQRNVRMILVKENLGF